MLLWYRWTCWPWPWRRQRESKPPQGAWVLERSVRIRIVPPPTPISLASAPGARPSCQPPFLLAANQISPPGSTQLCREGYGWLQGSLEMAVGERSDGLDRERFKAVSVSRAFVWEGAIITSLGVLNSGETFRFDEASRLGALAGPPLRVGVQVSPQRAGAHCQHRNPAVVHI